MVTIKYDGYDQIEQVIQHKPVMSRGINSLIIPNVKVARMRLK